MLYLEVDADKIIEYLLLTGVAEPLWPWDTCLTKIWSGGARYGACLTTFALI